MRIRRIRLHTPRREEKRREEKRRKEKKRKEKRGKRRKEGACGITSHYGWMNVEYKLLGYLPDLATKCNKAVGEVGGGGQPPSLPLLR